ncbi:hypothetical protein [Noviherbaspirillum denitrificans]|uniref:Uncharacterized protein n=1 Tax=Noviherbaspirillum denitrificans TaxID=1968433 RepID=A0A254THS8_9BURK|nr:hypothetical protein [Noviherbaspirillum denitrificans]OWW21737.1 hypothetical protein AYR66_21840 [Noviherbaspirillum denitrificans]
MKHVVQLPGPAIVNRAVHTMVVMVVALFAFHFARLAGFSAAAVAGAMLAVLVALASLGLRRMVSVDAGAQQVVTTVTLFSIPLREHNDPLPGMAWAGVRSDLPDLVVEVGTPSGEAVEVQRFRNAYGHRESEAIAACSKLAQALHMEDRGYA